jgi:glycosyltransferase involved in cell wall biosynthesis
MNGLAIPTTNISEASTGEVLAKERRPRIGIYETSRVTNGLSKYFEQILEDIDLKDYEIVLFCHTMLPYSLRDGVRKVFLSEESATDSIAGNLLVESHRKKTRWRTLFGRCWRAVTPAPLKLWAGYLRDAIRLARLFRSSPVDLMHIQLVGAEQAALAARLAGIPKVLGTFQIDSSQSRPRDLLLEMVSNHCLDRGIAVSESTRADWIKRTFLKPARVCTIPNGVDPVRVQRRTDSRTARIRLGFPSKVDVLLIGNVGRLVPQKGHTYLLQAIALLAPIYPDLYLVIAGDGPLRQELVEEAAALRIADRTRFLGHHADVQGVLDALDIFALPSLWEALPFALLEAMAAGLPAVGTTVAGVPEAITDGETGLLVPPADHRQFASALKTLIAAPDLRAKFGTAARQKVINQYDVNRQTPQIFQIYSEMLDSANGKGVSV